MVYLYKFYSEFFLWKVCTVRNFIFLLVASVVAVFIGAGCSSVNQTAAAGAAEKKVKIGLFVDSGASGNGVLHLASLIAHSPQTELVLLLASDIRAGKLKEVDVLVMPGGGSRKQCNAIGKAHWDKVREFLRNGGGYVGTCAGMFNVLECRMKLLPFDRHLNAGGNTACVSVEITPEAAKILDLKPGVRVVRYSGGPVAYKLENSKSEGKGIELGTYKSSVSRSKEQEGKFIDSTAWIYGTYGKGRVIATSFHPEYWESTHDMMLACFYAVSGVKMTPVFPKKNYRPVRVGILTIGMKGREPVETMLKLERDPDIDLDYVMSAELNQGILLHLDVLVIPECNKDTVRKYLAAQRLTDFMNRGGSVITTGKDSAGIVPEHKNYIRLPENACIKKYIVK